MNGGLGPACTSNGFTVSSDRHITMNAEKSTANKYVKFLWSVR